MTAETAPAPGRTWPALDGVRAVALVGVMTAHAFPLDHVLGRTGVGLITFFTLSGFLITGLLLKERQRFGDVSLRLFWARRAVRLLPALLMVLVALNALSLVGPEAIGDPPVEENAKASLAAFFYVGNWYDLTGFPGIPKMAWLTHLWSLGVEEQFYLVWPVLLLLALRRSISTALALTLVMIVVSPVLRHALYDGGVGGLRVARGTDTAADYLMWGAALALVQHRPGGPPAWLRRAGDLTALTGLAVIVAVVLAYDLDVNAEAPYTISFLAPASVLLIAGLVNAGRVLPWVLALPPLQLLGRMSYGIYLWHFPIYLAVAGEMTGRSGSAVLAVKVGVTLAIASVAYALVEKPVNDHWRRRLQRRPLPAPPVAEVVPAARLELVPVAVSDVVPAARDSEDAPAAGPAPAVRSRRAPRAVPVLDTPVVDAPVVVRRAPRAVPVVDAAVVDAPVVDAPVVVRRAPRPVPVVDAAVVDAPAPVVRPSRPARPAPAARTAPVRRVPRVAAAPAGPATPVVRATPVVQATPVAPPAADDLDRWATVRPRPATRRRPPGSQ